MILIKQCLEYIWSSPGGRRQIIIYLLLLILFAFSGLKAKRTMFCSDFAFSKGAINFLIYSIWKQTQLIFICLRLIAHIISETPQSSLVAFWERWKNFPNISLSCV